MKRYYSTELPYSDELYHHGIKGQKWGVRRFQNSDGSLTPAGRARYYGNESLRKLGIYLDSKSKKTSKKLKEVGEKASKTAKAIGGKAVKTTKSISGKLKNKLVTSIKKRHPSLMTDEELIKFKKRLELERSYKDVVSDLNSRKFSSRTIAAVEDIIKSSSKKFGETLATNVGQNIAKRMFETKSSKLKEKNAISKERLEAINNRRALREAKDREAVLRDQDAITRDRQNLIDVTREWKDYNNRYGSKASSMVNRGYNDQRNAYANSINERQRSMNYRMARINNRARTSDKLNRISSQSQQPSSSKSQQQASNTNNNKKKKNKPANLNPGTRYYKP